MELSPYINFFDLETTGTSVTKDRIVSISCIKTDMSLNIIGKKLNITLNPTIEIPKEASGVHGITNEMVKGLPTFQNVARIVYDFFEDGCAIGGYNIRKFDIPLIYEEFSRCEIDFTPILNKMNIIDPCVIFHQLERRDLASALKFYCGLSFEDLLGSGNVAHNAENDNIACINVLEGQMFKYDYTDIVDVVEASRPKGNENFVDFEGKIILRESDGVAIFNFGKHKGNPVVNHRDFVGWMLGQDFSTNTKNVVKSLIS